MNYRHLYHAGSFTDVFKHVCLVALITSFTKKDKPFCYIDTHAGRGSYDLHSDEANKTLEYQTGIAKILAAENPPLLVAELLKCQAHYQSTLGSKHNIYPGSPLIARYFMRDCDKMIACELHPEEYQLLKKQFAKDKQVATHCADGYLSFKAFLPPKEKRGFVFIDPPYEKDNDFDTILAGLSPALQRWDSGCYVIWYPIKTFNPIENFYHRLRKTCRHEILVSEFTILPEQAQRLNGCGIVIINPSWKLRETLDDTIPWLWKNLNIDNQGHTSNFFL